MQCLLYLLVYLALLKTSSSSLNFMMFGSLEYFFNAPLLRGYSFIFGGGKSSESSQSLTNLSKTLAYRSLGGPPFGPRPLVGELVRYFFEKGSKRVRYHHAKTTSHKKPDVLYDFV